jgi:pyruvate dehydrogenase E2 component (dihydrolipoamide acetyltransferase)
MDSTVIPILMPQAGQSMEEGTIRTWLVQPGSRVEKGQAIFEVETDKAVVDVEAADAGRLARIVVYEGGTVAVKVPVAYLAENDADVDAFLAAQAGGAAAAAAVSGTQQDTAVPSERGESRSPSVEAPSTSPAVTDAVQQGEGRRRISPAARRIAGERGIDVSALGAGSGPGGRIVSTDLPAAAQPAGGGEVRRKMSRMRQAIAAGMLRSKQTIPHFYLQITIDADPLMVRYRDEKAKHPCSVNDFIVVACAAALREFPAMRSRIDGDTIVERATVDIGIAVGMDDGLLVPVLRDADRMSLAEISAGTRRIAEAARAGKVEGAGQGNFTITNLGMFGVEAFSAIIQPPEPAILAVGAVRETPVIRDERVWLGHVMTMTLSADHRLIDGLLAAKFMARVRELLEAP